MSVQTCPCIYPHLWEEILSIAGPLTLASYVGADIHLVAIMRIQRATRKFLRLLPTYRTGNLVYVLMKSGIDRVGILEKTRDDNWVVTGTCGNAHWKIYLPSPICRIRHFLVIST